MQVSVSVCGGGGGVYDYNYINHDNIRVVNATTLEINIYFCINIESSLHECRR